MIYTFISHWAEHGAFRLFAVLAMVAVVDVFEGLWKGIRRKTRMIGIRKVNTPFLAMLQ